MDSIADLPFASLLSVATSTIILILFWSAVNTYVAKWGPLKWVESVLETHHFIIASVSLVLAAYVADIGHNVLEKKTGYSVDPRLLGYFYHILKLVEWLDILLAAASGSSKITKYAAFSHIFLPFWSHLRVIARPDGNTDWRFQVIGDCLSRFASRAVPWLVEDLQTEQNMLNLAEESRWYPDLAITAFWAVFMFQGRRDSEQAIKSFGQPYKEEITARLLSVAILLYASYAKRQEDESKESSAEKRPVLLKESTEVLTAKSKDTSNIRQPIRRAR